MPPPLPGQGHRDAGTCHHAGGWGCAYRCVGRTASGVRITSLHLYHICTSFLHTRGALAPEDTRSHTAPAFPIRSIPRDTLWHVTAKPVLSVPRGDQNVAAEECDGSLIFPPL